MLPDWPASTGRNTASTTSSSIVFWKKPTTPAATKAVSRLSCSQGCRNLRLVCQGVESRSSFSTPTMAPGWALISIACSWNMTAPRTRPTRRPFSVTG